MVKRSLTQRKIQGTPQQSRARIETMIEARIEQSMVLGARIETKIDPADEGTEDEGRSGREGER
jgi:hypothetical protein